MKLRLLLLLILAGAFSLSGQKLVSADFLSTVPKNPLAGGIYDVDTYKIIYLTADGQGVEHEASGLLCAPRGTDIIFPLGCYQHGTVGSRDEVPSRGSQEAGLSAIFASHGYVVVAPDYVGLGDSPGIHPYVHSKTAASAAIDLLKAAREFADQSDEVFVHDQLFITGYSQGGHSAMALHKEIEESFSSDFVVTASAPMSGPYDVSGEMIDFTLGDEDYGTAAYLASLILGYLEVYPELLDGYTLADLFLPEYIPHIESYRDEQVTLWELNTTLLDILNTNHGRLTPKDMFVDGVVDAVKNDPTNPLRQALEDNNVYNWLPQAPIRMYYCEGDEQVVYTNAIVAETTMNDLGAEDVEAVRRDFDMNPLDHGGCVLPSSLAGLGWFDSIQQLFSTSTNELLLDARVYYAEGNIVVELDDFLQGSASITIYDSNGTVAESRPISTSYSRIDISEVPQGLYVVHLFSNGKKMSTKCIKH